MGFLKKAVLLALAVLISTSMFAQSSLKKANKQYELKAYNIAIKSYQKVLNKQENNVTALSRIADCYRHLNQMTEASNWYEKAVAQPKVSKDVFLNYGKTLKGLEEYDKAKTWFLKYAQKDPAVGKQYARSCDFAKKNKNNPANTEISNEFINTKGADFGAAIYKNRVVYASTRSDMKRAVAKNNKDWAGNSGNQLFISERDANMFLRTPGFLHADIKNQLNQGPVAYSADGLWVAFTSNNFSEGTRHIPSSGMELGLYIASVENDGDFSEAQAFPYNGTGYSTGYACFSPDGKTLYFASDRPDGFGGFDIYKSSRTGSSWSPPENLGNIVNSQGNEITPFFDGNSLHFASDWHDGLGGYDIFRAEKSGSRFTTIYHGGTGLNTSRDDFGYVYDLANNIGYLSSNRIGGKGDYDIYRIKNTSSSMVIQVIDENSRPLQGATIDFSGCGEGVFLTDASGLYSFQMGKGLNCSPIIRKQGYSSSSFKLSDDANSNSRKVVLRSAGSASGGVVNNSSTATQPSTTPNTTPSSTGLRDGYVGFNGLVINEYTNVGLTGVTVRAINQNDRTVMESITDGSGTYVIALQPNMPYQISYNKTNFYQVSRPITTGNGNDTSILGTTKLVSTSSSRPSSNSNPIVTTNPSSPATNPYPSKPSTTYTPPPANSSINGYSVQVASISANRDVDLSTYNSLSDIGTVYYSPVGNLYKIRVGTFATRAEAQAAAARLKERGYNGAFTVTEGDPSLYSSAARTSSAYTVPSEDEGTLVIPQNPGRYVVRLAAYSNPKKYFNREKVSDIGSIAEQYKGQFTIILLTGYTTIDQAARALSLAKSRGFNDAYIAEDVNGELKKIN